MAEPALDRLAKDLEALRISAGAVSYSDLAARIARNREAAGAAPAAAHIARSTVYDAFRVGRRRINPDLVAEIVLALTDDPGQAASWRARAIEDLTAQRRLRPVPPTAPAARPSTPTDAAAASATELPSQRTMLAVLIVVAAFALDNLGGQFVAQLGVPLYLDMVGTAIAAMALGPWYGVAAGLANNLLGSLLSGDPPSLWFALVNVVGALIWGYGVHRWGYGRGPLRFLSLNLIVAVACSVTAVPILVLVFGGSTGHPGQDAISPVLAALGTGLWGAVFSTNLLLSIADKLISGYLALLAVWIFGRTGLLRPAFGEGWLPGLRPAER